jgi:hypothetical protein
LPETLISSSEEQFRSDSGRKERSLFDMSSTTSVGARMTRREGRIERRLEPNDGSSRCVTPAETVSGLHFPARP